MRREIEIKLSVADPRATRRRLARLGFHRVSKRHFERNFLFDFPDRRLRKEGCLLRLRFEHGRCLLTFKGRRIGPRRFKVRPEIEARLADGPALGKILEAIGLRIAFCYEKYRTLYAREGDGNHTEVAYDETPIGTYLELEGPPRWIDRVARELGYGPQDYITPSYGRLYLGWCDTHRRKPAHMVFRATRDQV